MWKALKFPLFAFAIVLSASLISPSTTLADDLPGEGGCPRTTCDFSNKCTYDGNHGYCSGGGTKACSWMPCN